MHDNLNPIALAFRELARLVNKKWNGRRLERGLIMARWHFVPFDRDSPMTRVPMAPRALRRRLQGKKFRPVYGYVGRAL